MHADIKTYNDSQSAEQQAICNRLYQGIATVLTEAEGKIWHRAPVWFLEGNPIVGYWARKGYVQLLFWSGQSFDEPSLLPEGKFKAAEQRLTHHSELKAEDLDRCLKTARTIQWDYKNIVKRRGVLEKIGTW